MHQAYVVSKGSCHSPQFPLGWKFLKGKDSKESASFYSAVPRAGLDME